MVSNLTSNAIKKIERKIIGKGAVRAGKGLKLFISNEDMDDIINTKKPLEHSSLLFVGITESVKHKKKTATKGWYLGALPAPSAASLVQPVISSIVKDVGGKEVRRTGTEYMENNF